VYTGPSGESELIHLRLLGGFQVSVGTERIVGENDWRLRKAAGLVKLLALAPNHRMHRERMMDLLWPELDLRPAANNLRYALYKARQILEPARVTAASRYLQLRGDVLALCPSGKLWVDVEAFEEAAAAARQAHDRASLETAIELYAGELLPEDRYEEWAEGRREELQGTYLTLLLELAEFYNESEEFGLAIETLQRVVACEATNEGAHAELMRLYALSGQRHGALRQYEQLRKTLLRELGTEPGIASRRLYEDVLAGRYPPSGPSPVDLPRGQEPANASRYDLPTAKTSFVGRKRDLVGVNRALAMTRLLTLTGACGSGKSRLALEVARDLAGNYPDGVWLAELATLSEGVLVPQVVAAALGVRERPGCPITATLLDVLRRKKALLVLDNCEHLVDEVAHLVNTLLDRCPHLRILATSREALGIEGEVKWLVALLSLPDHRHLSTVENLAANESVQLFLQRSRYHRPDFVLNPRNAAAVADICRQLDGIPLAIELAAARMRVIPVKEIAARLKDSPNLLTVGSRTALPRQQTLRGTLDWSYALLTEPEGRLFRHLTVFVGSWTLEAAAAVGAGAGIGRGDVLDLLGKLVEKSLVVTEADMEGALRYRLLEPIRQYGWELLEGSGEADPAQRQHAVWFLELAEEAEPELSGVRQEAYLDLLEKEYDNLRMALSWAFEKDEAELGLRLGRALGEFWHLRGHRSEGRRWLETMLAKGEALAEPARARALAQLGCIAWEQGDYELSLASSEESLMLSRNLEDTAGVVTALSNLAWTALYQNELGQASELAEEAAALQRVAEDMRGSASPLLILGMVAAIQGDNERAMTLHEESWTLAREAEDNFAIVLSLALGAFTCLNQGYYERAGDLCAKGLQLSRRLNMTQLIATHPPAHIGRVSWFTRPAAPLSEFVGSGRGLA